MRRLSRLTDPVDQEVEAAHAARWNELPAAVRTPSPMLGRLTVMGRYGRIPMSFTHGDVDDDHLEAIVLRVDGTPRFCSVSFAVHVDSIPRSTASSTRPRTST